MEKSTNISVYRYAADGGLIVGGYLSVMALCFMLSLKGPGISLLLFPLGLGFPVLLGFMMVRLKKREPIYDKFSALWLYGIYCLIFGSIIVAAVTTFYMLVIEPGFLERYFEQSLEAAKQSGMAEYYEPQMTAMEQALEQHKVPTVSYFVLSMFWITTFFGSILSLFLAVLASIKRPFVKSS